MTDEEAMLLTTLKLVRLLDTIDDGRMLEILEAHIDQHGPLGYDTGKAVRELFEDKPTSTSVVKYGADWDAIERDIRELSR